MEFNCSGIIRLKHNEAQIGWIASRVYFI